MTLYLGIDPGKSGAIAAIDGKANVVYCGDTPDIAAIVSTMNAIIAIDRNLRAAIERVHAMPGQGVTSMFTFGTMFGAASTALVFFGVPHVFTRAQNWQKGILPLGLDLKDRKAMSVKLAIQRYGDAAEFLTRKKDHGRADAMHLADVARRFYALETAPDPVHPLPQ